MELSEELQRGLHRLADPALFSPKAFAALIRASFLSVSEAQAAERALLGKEIAGSGTGTLREPSAAFVLLLPGH
ncbi:hypothetical protein XELAEV_18030791mg [Xenopus laevis]|uniref:Uncharacterized protein n=1 Tax=Xenopus laevis TaxID=8355 RepID=A0A974CLV4_XENLA|nr:hypothetical protein XELAEV_18030791mg [Xenopus laevis]